jgi:hypothetical protein
MLYCYNCRLEFAASLKTVQFRKQVTAVIYLNLLGFCRTKCGFRCRRIPTRVPPFLASSNIHLFCYRSFGYCILVCMVGWRVGRLLNNIGRISPALFPSPGTFSIRATAWRDAHVCTGMQIIILQWMIKKTLQ